MKRICCTFVTGVAALAVAPPAGAWEQWIGGGPGFVQNLASQAALSTDANGRLCVLTNDRVQYSGRIEFAHYRVYDAAGVADPLLSNGFGHPEGLTTSGIDCRFGPPVIGVSWIGSDLIRHDELNGRSEDGSAQWTANVPSFGSARPTRFGAGAARAVSVLHEHAHGRAFDLLGMGLAAAPLPSDAAAPLPLWSANFASGPFPDSAILALHVAADGSTSVIGTYNTPFDATDGVFVQRYGAQGNPLPGNWNPYMPDYPIMGQAAFSAGGTAYLVRSGDYLARDVLWRVGAQPAAPQMIDPGFSGPVQVVRLVALADDGALVLTRSGYGGLLELARYAADGTLSWNQPVPQVSFQRVVLDLIGDRAGRALVVSADLPGQPTRSYALDAYGPQGWLWTSTVPNARFDDGTPVALAVTSDDRAVVALQVSSRQGPWEPGILLRSSALDQPLQ